MRLSIIIVNYNVEHFLEQCLLSVQKACKGIESEVIVVDNASVDGSVEMVRSRFPEVRLIANPDNKGFSKANNQGIRQSSGDYVLLLNPDTVVEEETFSTCIQFMDQHPEAGGLGVRMLDGKGGFLPESKRGLPTPMVAFYKIFGLSRLFPRSERFNRYHLGHLDEFETHEVEILSGAYMFMRRKALDEVGLLDEDYFMYGEDIDLSYRLIKGGYKNYYTPETRIIHYKGESTKRTSINYVMVFYNAMRIFAKKHFSDDHAKYFGRLIELAIFVRALLSILKRFAQKVFHPLIDTLLLSTALLGISHLYAEYTGVIYDSRLLGIALPAYALVWVITAFLASAYEYPLKDRRKIQGVVIGTALILILYSLLPENYRFSRAIILLGTLAAGILFLVTNALWRALSPEAKSKEDAQRVYLVVGGTEERSRVQQMMVDLGIESRFIHEIDPEEGPALGERIRSTTEVYAADEVIFCAKDLSADRIIDLMSTLDSRRLDFKIAPPESLFIIGSNSKDNKGDLLALEMNSIAKPVNQRNKRILDFLSASFLLIIAPLFMWLQHRPVGFLRNGIRVLIGQRTWVGFYRDVAESQHLPDLRPGILAPDHGLVENQEQKKRSNLLYAKDYRVSADMDLILKNWRNLGLS
ncbi:MAG: glycosyltransferase [Flavobacteriales bacterium]|nr:glycosyltransferase [Flavobacteriales bacterium]